MRGSLDEIDAATRGEITHAEAGRRIFARLGALDFVPPYMGFGNPEQGATATFTLPAGARHVTWYRRHGTPAWKENCTFPLTTYAREALKWAMENRREGRRRGRAGVRDILFADNQEWRSLPPAMSAHGQYWPPIPPAAEPESQVAQEITA